MRNFILIFIFVVIASGGTAFSQAKPIDELQKMFDYQQNTPLDFKENGVEDKNGASIHDITYASPKGGRVSAYLVVPSSRKGKFAGIIFMHQRPEGRKISWGDAFALCWLA